MRYKQKSYLFQAVPPHFYLPSFFDVNTFFFPLQVQRKLARALGRRTTRRSLVPAIRRASRAETGDAFGKVGRPGASVGNVTRGLLLPLALLLVLALPTCFGERHARLFVHFGRYWS